MRFVLIDAYNLIHRMKHVVKHYEGFDEAVSMILHNVFTALRKAHEKFGANHVVACFDSYSWRSEYFPDYKADRREEQDLLSPSKIEEREILRQVISELRLFLSDFTNVTVLEAPGIEADDFIARWVMLHSDPAFSHIIVSADGDFRQLVGPNVHLYDPLYHRLYLPNGVYYNDGKPFRKGMEVVEMYGEKWKVKYNKDTAEPEEVEPEWFVFERCIRGGKNNLRSAYPRVQTKRLRRAFEDRGGVEWNNILNHIWGPDDDRQSVRKRYEFNRLLFDLRRQPQEVLDIMDEEILNSISKEPNRMIGVYFAKFAAKYQLKRLLNFPDPFVRLLSLPYET